MAMHDADLKRSAWRSIAAFQRLIGDGATLLEHDDYVASRVPESHSSVINAVVPRAPIAAHVQHIADFYSGVPKWGVWIDPDTVTDAEALQRHGLVLDSTPVLMAAGLADVQRAPETRVKRVSLDEVGMVNDAAYGIPAGTFADALVCVDAREVHAYGIQELKEAVSVAIVQDVEADTFVTFVATLPDYRGERLASTLLQHALHEAHERGQATTSLQASKLGQGIYARLGYHALGEIHLYEKRPA
jgi:ribosomal protein S18 acetylase RimI-like enzyme